MKKRVSRDRNGRRVYEESDAAWIQFIRRLKETGMPLREIQRYSKLRYQGESTMLERLEMLKVHREYVLDQQRKWAEYLENLDGKISLYQRTVEGRKTP